MVDVKIFTGERRNLAKSPVEEVPEEILIENGDIRIFS